MPMSAGTPLFSVVIPAYNMERYLGEAVDSLLEQTIGFEENIQVILVNDGSLDDTRAICLEYAKRWPGNIVFIDKSNGGVAAARNVGLAQATGTYINFLDADDKWSEDAFQCAAVFFKRHPEARIVAAKHTYFGVKECPHVLSYKFAVNQVIDLERTVDFPQLSFSNAFVHRDLLEGRSFCESLKVSEDFLLINQILMDELRYGVMLEPTYWYRKRDEGGSAIDTSCNNISWYEDTPRLCYKALFEQSKERFGFVAGFIQYAVMYDLQWRIRAKAQHPLTEEQFESYKQMIISLLQDIDDELILAQRNLDCAQKLYVFALKYQIAFASLREGLHVVGSDVYLYLPQGPSIRMWGSDENSVLAFEFMKNNDDGSIRLEGHYPSISSVDGFRLVCRSNSIEYEADIFLRDDYSCSCFFENDYCRKIGFRFNLPALCEEMEFLVVLDSRELTPTLRYGKFFPMPAGRIGYAVAGKKVLTQGKEGTLCYKPRSKKWIFMREIAYEASIWRKNKGARSVLKYRRDAVIKRLFGRKRAVWLISDRIDLAGDNGEALFRYLAKHPIDGVKPVFVLGGDSSDFLRLSIIGKVVAYDSPAHKSLSLEASVILSSAGEDCVFNRFGRYNKFFKDLNTFKFVFLQHGITKDDMSSWLKRRNKNIALFITAAQREADSITNNGKYGYGSDVVKLTGFPRHDVLLEKSQKETSKKKVLIAPTWRRYLTGNVDPETGARSKNQDFRSSDYYTFYARLLNDPRIELAVKKGGYSVDFLIHPSLSVEADEFSSTYASICTEYDYSQLLVDSSIMVTDYSSVVFDFALLKRPVLYCQFDYDVFFGSHMDKGYYSYEDDGFGPVCYAYEESVQELLSLLEFPCMAESYKKRVDEFFYYPDCERSEEVVRAIRELVCR